MFGIEGSRKHARDCSYAPELPSKKTCFNFSVDKNEVNFTYIPKSQSEISHITLTQRSLERGDVVTIYYPEDYPDDDGLELPFETDGEILHEDLDHSPDLHNPETPEENHCHEILKRENIKKFIKELFEEHGVLGHIKPDLHHLQFMASIKVFSERPSLKGVKFSDGSYSANIQCENIKHSKKIDVKEFFKCDALDTL